MKWWLLGVGSCAAGLWAECAEARVEFDVGARIGYAIPTGKLAGEQESEEAFTGKLADWAKGEVPLALALNVRVIPMLALGGYVELAPALLGSRLSSSCDNLQRECGLIEFRFGLMAHYHALPHHAVDPWFGVGIGFEGLGVSEKLDSGQTINESNGGFEIPLRAGVDFKLSEKFYLGPYLGYSFGKFTTYSYECDGAGCPGDHSLDLKNRTTHGWVGFGASLTVLAF